MNAIMSIDTTLTMTSREIADLVGSRHDDTKRSIERLANQGVSKPEIFCKTSYTKPPSNPDFQKKWEQEITKYEASQISSDPSSEVPTPVDPRIEVAKAGITASQRRLERAWTAIPASHGR
ncbi:hypothetical protein [Acidovorax sp.]|uniref:hypothetical protein n=1 Tax=Acidovorax sp. TaxID=1872122 RepID=UPI0025C016A1|nr:hypothetical protein [Acidovorax sp.]MBL7091661.1 hypothetical protein [Acidovorax sp.]